MSGAASGHGSTVWCDAREAQAGEADDLAAGGPSVCGVTWLSPAFSEQRCTSGIFENFRRLCDLVACTF